MKRGFLILAHGKPEYLKFAANLAMSIRERSKYDVCVLASATSEFIQSDGFLKLAFMDIVGKSISVEHDRPFYAKTVLNQYTPFDDTIYIDADSLCINDPDSLFETECEFETHLTGRLSYIDDWRNGWAPLDKMYDFYEWDADQNYQ